MGKEIETRIPDIDKAEIAARLETLGAKKVKDVLQRRMVFDYPDRRLDAMNAWIRLCDTGDGKIQLAYKCLKETGKTGVADCHEVEFAVSDMEKAEQFLTLIGLEKKSYQENKRISYELEDVEFDIDEWPMIPSFVEIEGPSVERVMAMVERLGYTEHDTMQGDAGAIYLAHGIDWKSLKEITFER